MKKSSSKRKNKVKKEDPRASWKLVYRTFQPAKEGLREALCTLGNGYMGTRGSAPETVASRTHYPGTYMAGLYNKLPTHMAGKTIINEDFVNCPNWTYVTFKVGEEDWIVPSECEILDYYQALNMSRGVLTRKTRIKDKHGRIFRIRTRRIVHMAEPHLAAVRYSIIPENYEGYITIRSGLDGSVENTGVPRYRELASKHLRPVSAGKIKKGIRLAVKTSQSHILISHAARTEIYKDGKKLKANPKVVTRHKDTVYQDFRIQVEKHKKYQARKIVAIYTSKDKGVKDANRASIKHLKSVKNFDQLFETHKRAWMRIWKKFHIDVVGDVMYRRILRLHIFHLMQTSSFHNAEIDAGCPARGLHGEAYRGHIFWDQLFVMPFYNLRAPEIAKSLLLYRYRRIGEARKAAIEHGYRGAMFPWQSASTGDEQTQVVHLNPISGKWGPDFSHNQRHVSFAIANNVWQHWKFTEDLDFLIKYGAEMILSIAQFGSSLAKYSKKDKRYHTGGLMGPDEFHEKFPGARKGGFKDNSYTNLLIVSTLLNSLEILESLPPENRDNLLTKLKIDQKELDRWEDITRKMNIIINKKGIISQFDGYMKLKDIDWDAYRKKYGNIHRMDRILKAEGKSPDAYKVAKQADALMIFYVLPLAEVRYILKRLGYKLDMEMLERNYEYYKKRTSHGSTLSKGVFCYLSHLLGKEKEAWELFLDVLKSDIYDVQGGTTPEGIHVGVMASSIHVTLRCFAGIDIQEHQINISPNLPKNWRSIKFRIYYRRRWIAFMITKRRVEIFIDGPKSKMFSTPFTTAGKQYNLVLGKKHKISLKREITFGKKEGELKMAQKRVLVVDGDVSQVGMLRSRLEAAGYLVETAYTGKEALSVLKTEWVDAVVMSVLLQDEVSGFKVFEEMKETKQFAAIPVIMQTDKTGLKKMFKKMGAEAFFAKPFSIDSFLKKVKSILGQ